MFLILFMFAGSLSGVWWGQSAWCRGADAASVYFTLPGGSVWCHYQICVLWRSVHNLHDRSVNCSSLFHSSSPDQWLLGPQGKILYLLFFYLCNLCNCFFNPIPDRGIIMTFGSGSNGCLGHGNFNDVTQVHVSHCLVKAYRNTYRNSFNRNLLKLRKGFHF